MTDSLDVDKVDYHNNAILFLLIALLITFLNLILQLINNQSYFTKTTSFGPYYIVSSISSCQILIIIGVFYAINYFYDKKEHSTNPKNKYGLYAIMLCIFAIVSSCIVLIQNVATNYV